MGRGRLTHAQRRIGRIGRDRRERGGGRVDEGVDERTGVSVWLGRRCRGVGRGISVEGG